MNMHILKVVLLWLMLSSIVVISAQPDACPETVNNALALVADICRDTGRNQLCYGNHAATIEAEPDAPDLHFAEPGDIADVAGLHLLRLSPLDESVPQWGVVLMMLQANLPETLPGQNVVFLLLGDVELTSAVDPTDDSANPMSAFYLQAGIGDAPCQNVPQSGVLIQTPEGEHEVTITVNEVAITLHSTVYLRAEAGHALFVDTLEGQAEVTVLGETSTAQADEQVFVRINDGLQPTSPPSDPRPSDLTSFTDLALGTLAGFGNEARYVVDVTFCVWAQGGELTIAEGDPVYAGVGVGLWFSTEDARAMQEFVNTSITLDGVPLPFIGFGEMTEIIDDDGTPYYGYGADYELGSLSAGDYVLEAHVSYPGTRPSLDGGTEGVNYTEQCLLHVE